MDLNLVNILYLIMAFAGLIGWCLVVSGMVFVGSIGLYHLFKKDKLISNFTFLSTKKIRQAINLLPKEYNTLTTPIYIFPNHLFYDIYIFFMLVFNTKSYIDNITPSTYGSFIHQKDRLDENGNINNINNAIIIFNKESIVQTLCTLFHEFRHVYQFQIGYTQKNEKNYQHYTEEISYSFKTNNNLQMAAYIDTYNQQFIEKDANIFAKNFFKKHQHKLKNWFGFDYIAFNVNSNTGYFTIKKYKEKTIYWKLKTLKEKYKKGAKNNIFLFFNTF